MEPKKGYQSHWCTFSTVR